MTGGKMVLELQKYFNGEVPVLTAPLILPRQPRFKEILAGAAAIAYGAKVRGPMAGLPGAIGAVVKRAVGTAFWVQPFPDRHFVSLVIRQDGGMGGFSAVRGIELKKTLLRLEGISDRQINILHNGVQMKFPLWQRGLGDLPEE